LELVKLLAATGHELRGISTKEARALGLLIIRLLEEEDNLQLFPEKP
jgi:hypothetical protein